ncbi:aspartate/glutamate racemase family protein [Rhodococcus sp. SGAir0479]|uniref:aspartate/glutamate racemase family protein n=1 Tax=Rhodococcus sp. SGAir0479 TaxID=2567884 RepID=UPI0020C7948F|nr:aspartate/glutamate racemase family protein [Rhodococcus sp. SGAir0479]
MNETPMRRIGMLGGMSWESTVEYYRLTNELVRARLGGVHSARIVLDSVDFADIETLQAAGEWEKAGVALAARAHAVEAAGAELIVLCTNTMHVVIDAIEDAVSVPVLHIADATARSIRAAGLTRVGLLGTAFTMDRDFYRGRLAGHGIDTIVPGAWDRQTVHTVIYDELVRGIVSDASRDAYRAVIERLVVDGAEGIILGCTEIELLVSASDSPVPVFPTTRLHVEAAVDLAFGDRLDGRSEEPST